MSSQSSGSQRSPAAAPNTPLSTGKTARSLAVFVLVVAAVFAGREAVDRLLNAKAGAPEIGEAPPVVVSLVNAEKRRFAEIARTQGTLLSRDFALVSPRNSGLVTSVPVREGDLVVKDKTVLFTMDNVSFAQTAEVAERNLDVARFTLVEKKASYDKDLADHKKTARDWQRYQELFRSNSISESQLDAYRADYEKASAQLQYAESLVDLAKSQIKVAEANLAIAKKDLEDTVVRSPVHGFVTLRAREPGQNAAPGEAIVRVDDIRLLEATGFLAGMHYPRIVAESQRTIAAAIIAGAPEVAREKRIPDPDKIPISQVQLTVGGNGTMRLPLTYKAPAVDQSLRTFKIKVNVQGDGHRLVPGMLVDLGVEMRSEEGVGVPKTAVAERNGKPCVFVVEDGKAKGVPVEAGIEYENWMLITSKDFREGTPVIDGGATLAQIQDGTPVTVRAPAANGEKGNTP